MTALGVVGARVARPSLSRAIADGLAGGHVLLVAGAGYGKTAALEEAVELAGAEAVWVACGECAGEAARLLLAVVDGLRATVPGLADAVGDRLALGAQAVDAAAAAGGLLAELERLLVERVVIVFDDADELERSRAALAFVERLMNARRVPLSVAVASRQPLRLRLAKLRAAGLLTEIGPAELSFTAGECAALLALRHGRSVSEPEVEAVLAASHGWPMGVALTSLAGSGTAAAAVPHDELFEFLAEDVIDRLPPATRLAVVDSSVPAMLTPGLAEALGLPPTFIGDTERRGLFLRRHASGACSYHPLFRAFLLGRLRELRSDHERADLHAKAAGALAQSGLHAEAIEHWLAAGRHEEALLALRANASELVRTVPGSVEAWLERLPAELHSEPAYLLLRGHVLWSAGHHDGALEPLRTAVAGYRQAGDEGREWVGRLYLADSLFSVGAFGEIAEAVRGWDAVADPTAAETAAGVAWYQVMALAARGDAEAEPLAERLRADADRAGRSLAADALARVGTEPAAGRSRELLERLGAAVAELERRDRYGSLPYLLSMVSLVHRDLGDDGAALDWLDRTEREAERIGLGFVVRDCQLQRAFLLARAGRLGRAKLELAHAGKQRGTGWRGVHRHEAEAQVAALRGDPAAAVTAATRALRRVAPGAVCYRVWTAVNMAPVLADNGAPDAARAAVDEALAVLDACFPGSRGRLHRAGLLASRARLEYDTGEPERSCASLAHCWAEAGPQADQVIRAHWPGLQPALWHALAEGALSPDGVLPAMRDAFPGGGALMAMVDHPAPAVRRAALSSALAAGHPAALARLGALAQDADEQIAAAATAATERLRSQRPALRFELLGGFRVRRAGWELDEGLWERPMAVRVVRFLLISGAAVVPEDTLFEAFWPDRAPDSARQHLAVAVSRARKVLDLPGLAQESVIEARERTYRLRLREHDSVDSAEFETAAAVALVASGGLRAGALEHAAELWTGEPLPEDRYATWSSVWRNRLVSLHSQVLAALIEHYEAAGRHDDVILVAQRLLESEPLNEAAHRRLMLAFARTGRTSLALRQFLACRRSLVVEFGVEPSNETSRLQARILAGEPV